MGFPELTCCQKGPDSFNFAVDIVDKQANAPGALRAMLWTDNADSHGRDLSYEYFSKRSHLSAGLLNDLGIRCGDTMIIMLSRVPAWWEIATGALRAGIILSPCSTLATSKDIKFRALAAQASIFVGDQTAVNAFLGVRTECPQVKTIIQADGEPIPGIQQYKDLMGVLPENKRYSGPVTLASDPAFILFTSGTTGPPKMVVHNHSYPLSHRTTGEDWLLLEPGKLYWNLAELGWAKSLWGWFAAWNTGAALYVRKLQGTFSAREIVRTLHLYPITTFCAGSTAYRQMVHQDVVSEISKAPLSCLEHCVAAGEALEKAVIESWRDATGIEIKDGYGQTETTILCGNFKGNVVKRGSMGRAARGIPLSVVNEYGEECQPGEEGSIAVKLRENMIGITEGYLQPDGSKRLDLLKGKPATNGSACPQWYLTGDRGYRDIDGYFWYLGRADDVINSSGYRIGPTEVESVLLAHSAVKNVAVVASPSAERGDVVKAFVVLADHARKQDPAQLIKLLQAHCKKESAPYKYPRRVEFVDEAFFPKTTSGKIQRALLRKMEEKRFSVQAKL
ncbi:acyl-coenzyme A synthetase ACSM3 [Dactylonectria estremocensis]|uniref:medium-chain acyl-CoA ligase n=1 Tax=Dactylonectria estremocensis TaxID=1079267 RepID=A0A9P9DLP4_9HYPO|nr:acyl-coenzyme A synthetase ACSM3 [Dactylonectria estremocensis]